MYCIYCGQRNEDGSGFCSACGQPLSAGAPAPAVTDAGSLGIASMICGIVSVLVVCESLGLGLICGVAAVVLGVMSRKRESRRGFSTAGIICGSVGLAMFVLAAVMLLLSFWGIAATLPQLISQFGAVLN